MPIKLISPRPGKTPYYAGRGKHLGTYVDRSTKASNRTLALKILKKWEREIESGTFIEPGELTFAAAAIDYMNAGGDRRPLAPLIKHFGDSPCKLIGQKEIDRAAAKLMPNLTPATQNREVYSPVSAILKRAGFDFRLKRPKGWRGKIIRKWLWPEQAWRVLEAAYTIEPELGILCTLFLFGGLRLSEQLAMMCDDVRIEERFAWVPDSKNGDPQPMHLNAAMIDALKAHPRGIARPGERLFRFHKGGGLDFKLIQACAIASNIDMPKRAKRGSKWPTLPPYEFDWVSWHTFRRTYATWMRRYGGLDDKDLVDTYRWRTVESASRYAQTVVGEAAKQADVLPLPPKSGVSAETKKITS
jgi:integrase